MLKQVQKLITQGAGPTATELTLGTNPNTVITQCYIASTGTGIYSVRSGPDATSIRCFGGNISNSISFPIESFLAPVHNLTNVITVRTSTFTAGDEINVIINYREFEDINTTDSAITLSNAAYDATTIGLTPLLSNSSSTVNYNIKSVYLFGGSTTNTLTLLLTTTEFPAGIPMVGQFTGSAFYRAMALPEQTLLKNGDAMSLNMTEAVNASVFISYTQVPA